MNSIEIRAIELQDKAQWQVLFSQYAHFYKVGINDAILAKSWSWLHDTSHPLQALVAVSAAHGLVGLAHFRACPDALIGQDIGYLDDLFVATEHRGAGIARRLIEGVQAIAQAQQWPLVRWVTASDNHTAQRLYDSLAERTTWLTYDLRA
ncbi:GNAT family N-acetyltransferase [Lampropedia aestuarii]|uniref:GNAT family N-acetyltransferase n=1 Tax=Lampropedia aestuarii TaxID=2562762 RepID=UPI002468707E|nr:GNAT family N-acetyltransferase [Lampropedia aestuarii]MDH5856361.1 GNAT family N-acetyltransferase [Lampropedia aestuarii]